MCKHISLVYNIREVLSTALCASFQAFSYYYYYFTLATNYVEPFDCAADPISQFRSRSVEVLLTLIEYYHTLFVFNSRTYSRILSRRVTTIL